MKPDEPVASTTGPVDEAGLPMLQRIVVSALGIACLVTGAIATFVTSNGAGSAALLAGGLGLLVLAYLGNRLDLLKFGGFEAHLRKANMLLGQADELERHGRRDEADALRAQADRLLLEVAPHARALSKCDVRNQLVPHERDTSTTQSTKRSSTRVTIGRVQTLS